MKPKSTKGVMERILDTNIQILKVLNTQRRSIDEINDYIQDIEANTPGA